MSNQQWPPEEFADEQESLHESLAALLRLGHIRWNRRFRNGRPVFVITDRGRQMYGRPLADEGGPVAGETESNEMPPGEWEGEHDALELIVPDLLADENLCESIFASKSEAFKTGLCLARRASAT